MSVDVSIIIPVYNVSKYLNRCLDSVDLLGNLKYEIILVNDGSTDCSGDICSDYAQKYNNVLLVNKNNGGLSDARNEGIKISTGEYIYFLDSDDWLVNGAISELLNSARNYECQIVQGGFYYAYSNYLLFDERYFKNSSDFFIINKSKAMEELITNCLIKNFAWGKLYRADIVKKFLFPIGKYFEDCYWQHYIINETERYGIIRKPLYYYRQRETGISGTFSLKNLDLLKGYKERISFLRDYYPYLVEDAILNYNKVCIDYMECAYKMHDPNLINAVYNYLKNNNIKYNRICYKIQNVISKIWNHYFAQELTKINYEKI